MSDLSPETATPVDAAQQAEPQAGEVSDTPETVDPRQYKKVQSEAKNLRERLKAFEAAEAERQQRELEATGNYKTLLEQAQARISEFEQRETQRQRQADIAAALKAAGLSDDWADRVRGASLEELTADAKTIAKRLQPPAPSTGATNPGRAGGELTLEQQLDKAWAKRGSGSSFRL